MRRGAFCLCLLLGAAGASRAEYDRRLLDLKAERERFDQIERQTSRKADVGRGEVEAAIAKLETLKTEVANDIAALGRLAERYGDEAGTKALHAEREALNARLAEGSARASKLRNEINNLKKNFMIVRMAPALSGARVPESDTLDARRFEWAQIHALNFSNKAKDALEEDREAYQAALRERARRRRRLLAGLTAIILVLAAAWALSRRGAPEAPPPEPPAPLMGGQFRVERELGRGGMGVVLLAEDVGLGRKVAIKRMRAEGGGRKELDMFLAEARTVAGLKHPNIVEIYHIFTEGGQVHLVFEHVAGKTLDELQQDRRPLPPARVADVLRQTAAGLDYAHARKILHRDLKPANIMLTPEGVVKIMDFGLAHRVQRTMARQTRAAAWGTPPYMAPEQEIGKVSRESDIFALGACAYEMLTGTPAFDGPNYLAQKREMIFKPPSAVAPQLPKGMDAVIRKALEAEPGERYHSGAEFFNAFRKVLSGPS